ncbi:MAG: YheC/YheD family protein [Candidatus Omnitrophota bacterium]
MKNQNNITVLTLGNKYDFDSFRKLHKSRRLFKKKGFNYATSTYDNLLKNKLPEIKTKKVIIFPFFPFSHWNRHIEHRNYQGIYGASSFYEKFLRFFKKVDHVVKRNLKGKDLSFINSPILSSELRDKVLVKRKLRTAKVPTPQLFKISKIDALYRYTKSGNEFMIKPRYGSMGKGITFLNNDRCQTNFSFRNKKILSRKSDYGWNFRTIKDRHGFLKELLKNDVYIEEAVKSRLIDGKKFDLRVYVFSGEVIYIYARTNEADSVTTNISQGGKGMNQAFLKKLPPDLIRKIKQTAIKTAKVLGTNFAGVDIIVDKNFKNIYVLDVNFFPGFPKKKTFDLTARLVKLLKAHLKVKV